MSPITAPHRAAVLEQAAHAVLHLPADAVARVAIDGIHGAGKTTFADELATLVEAAGRPVIRASVDGFHRPRTERYRLGRAYPEGFYRDSYDYEALRSGLLPSAVIVPPVRSISRDVAADCWVTPAHATRASGSMSPEQAARPVPPVDGWRPASTRGCRSRHGRRSFHRPSRGHSA